MTRLLLLLEDMLPEGETLVDTFDEAKKKDYG